MQDDITYIIAHNLRHYRKLRKLSLKKLAHSLGVSYQAIQKYEQGHARISAANLFIIAQNLNIEICELYKYKEIDFKK